MALDRLDLQQMEKKSSESFNEYAQRWRDMPAEVQPPLTDKEMTSMFMNILRAPFYVRMIGNASTNFSDIIVIGERIEYEIKHGRLTEATTEYGGIKKGTISKKKEGEVHAIGFPNSGKHKSIFGQRKYEQNFPSYISNVSHIPYNSYVPVHTVSETPKLIILNSPRPFVQGQGSKTNSDTWRFDPVPMTYTELLPQLIQNRQLALIPIIPIQPPYPKWYDSNAQCDYHAGEAGHSTENCSALKRKVQSLINVGWLSLKKSGERPNVNENPLPNHENPKANAVDDLVEKCKNEVHEIVIAMNHLLKVFLKQDMQGRKNEKRNVKEHYKDQDAEMPMIAKDIEDKKLVTDVEGNEFLKIVKQRRPWIPSAGVVPSTLHQKLKFIVGSKLICVMGEEDFLITKPVSTPYVEATEEALECSFRSFEIAQATMMEAIVDEVIKPHKSKVEVMTTRIMESDKKSDDEDDVGISSELLRMVEEEDEVLGPHQELVEAINLGSQEESKEGSAFADHLAAQPVADYETMRIDFPDENIFLVEKNARDHETWTMLFDGASNELEHGIEVVLISPEGKVFPLTAKLCFECTHNIAEHEACIMGLQVACDMSIKKLKVLDDSMLVIHQVKEECETRDAKLVPYSQYVIKLSQNFEKISFDHVPREDNRMTDALAILAVMFDLNLEFELHPIQITKRDVPEYCMNVGNDNKPWYFDIKEYIKCREYPYEALENDKRTIRRLAMNFFLSGEVLYKRNHDMVLLRCVDEEEAKQIMTDIHEGICGTHANGHTMARQILRSGYYWTTMKSD
ncbi:uncharacterized protein E6C27_scaffold118G00070 [Cucumis melo var. makuwa]|uniref:RNase H type-1 domain-containing protein n=1 Tax=Cucumis melo var. makuwa TaxID=1194695 RepID=A0A5A7T9Q5_CUCMM|nr:uncharacterized protein E6C27_scaffold118G00070 [Cucumis melo var. makuwa]